MELKTSSLQKNNLAFSSLCSPIKPRILKLGNEIIHLQEETDAFVNRNKNTSELTKFFLDNFIDGSINPRIKKLQSPWNIIDYIRCFVAYQKAYRECFKRDYGRTTILTARNKDGQLVGAIITRPFEVYKQLNEPNTRYIDSVAVDKYYRGNNLGKTLINISESIDNDYFTDTFLTSMLTAVKFYKKLGFETISETNSINKQFLKKLTQYRPDYKIDMLPMQHRINPSKTHWLNRLNLDTNNH